MKCFMFCFRPSSASTRDGIADKAANPNVTSKIHAICNSEPTEEDLEFMNHPLSLATSEKIGEEEAALHVGEASDVEGESPKRAKEEQFLILDEITPQIHVKQRDDPDETSESLFSLSIDSLKQTHRGQEENDEKEVSSLLQSIDLSSKAELKEKSSGNEEIESSEVTLAGITNFCSPSRLYSDVKPSLLMTSPRGKENLQVVKKESNSKMV